MACIMLSSAAVAKKVNKKASEKINAAMFLLYLILIAGGITVVLSSYVNSPVDVRNYESQILYDKIMNCIVSEGYVKNEVLNSDFDLFSACKINKAVIESSNLYFEFDLKNQTDGEMKSFLGGDNLMRAEKKQDCDVIRGKNMGEASSCLYKNETYLYANGTNIVNVRIFGWVSSDNSGVRK